MASSTRFRACAVTAVAALLTAPAGVGAQRGHPTPAPFLDIVWGAPRDSVLATARTAGLQFLSVDDDGDLAFRGLVAGQPALVFATVGDSGLVRLVVSIDSHGRAASTFERVRDTLSSRFGAARLVTDDDGPWRPAPALYVASAWRGILLGLRRDGRILVVFTCPSGSPRLPLSVEPSLRAAGASRTAAPSVRWPWSLNAGHPVRLIFTQAT